MTQYLSLLGKRIPFVIIAIFSLSILSFTVEGVAARPAMKASNNPLCISYDSKERLITVTCRSARLTDIANKLKDGNILKRQSLSSSSSSVEGSNNRGREETNSDTVWLLNAGLLIDKGATFYINSTDTKWLKLIAAEEKTDAYPIQVYGSLKVDSVKITSWNPKRNDYSLTPGSERNGTKTHIGTPRPYIRVEEGATGTTDITNSEIAYLGYEGGLTGAGVGRTGFRYDGGDGSIIKNNNIHHLWLGFYSKRVGGLVIENNHIHHNGYYGLDPHTGTHDMIIRNNTVHDNGSIGIICSLDCYNVSIENNKVYNNAKTGIMFSRNMTNSVARNNIVSNETRCIFISQSHNNEIYNNSVSDCDIGINLSAKSSKNTIYNNIIANSTKDIVVDNVGTGNKLYSNEVMNTAGITSSIPLTAIGKNNDNHNESRRITAAYNDSRMLMYWQYN